MCDDIQYDIIQKLISKKKYGVVPAYSRIAFDKEIVITEYCGNDIRVFKNNDKTNILCPKDMSIVQENAVVNSIANGTIFDDADTVDNTAKYIELCALPHRAITNNGKESPRKLKIIVSMVMGKMDDNGAVNIEDADIDNSHNLIKDVIENKCPVDKALDNYMNANDVHSSIDDAGLRYDISHLENEIKSINDIPNEDAITDDDFEYLNSDDKEEGTVSKDNEIIEEGFFSKKPKKLKPIPRDVISYIMIELNAIQDANDQAMLSGYTCSKLELVDFYLNVIDTKDERYIVPHTRDYLVNMQNELNKLLAQILRIRPINRNDRVWRVNVNYPEDWRG